MASKSMKEARDLAPLTVSRLAVVQGSYLFVGCCTLSHTMMLSMPQAESTGAVINPSAAGKKSPVGVPLGIIEFIWLNVARHLMRLRRISASQSFIDGPLFRWTGGAVHWWLGCKRRPSPSFCPLTSISYFTILAKVSIRA
jgi:hypothetical protein